MADMLKHHVFQFSSTVVEWLPPGSKTIENSKQLLTSCSMNVDLNFFCIVKRWSQIEVTVFINRPAKERVNNAYVHCLNLAIVKLNCNHHIESN